MLSTLRELRRRGDLTQIELAQKSGVARSRIQLAEAGTVELRPEELKAIKAAVIPELLKTTELLATELEIMVNPKQTTSNQGDSQRLIGDKEPKRE